MAVQEYVKFMVIFTLTPSTATFYYLSAIYKLPTLTAYAITMLIWGSAMYYANKTDWKAAPSKFFSDLRLRLYLRFIKLHRM